MNGGKSVNDLAPPPIHSITVTVWEFCFQRKLPKSHFFFADDDDAAHGSAHGDEQSRDGGGVYEIRRYVVYRSQRQPRYVISTMNELIRVCRAGFH